MKYMLLYQIFTAILLVAGCAILDRPSPHICDASKCTKISDDKFAYFQNGVAKYVVEHRCYKDNTVCTLYEIDLPYNQWLTYNEVK